MNACRLTIWHRPMLRYHAAVRILALCGSLQAKSSNLDLLCTAVALAPEAVEVVLFDGLRDLPLFNPDIVEAGATPPSVQAWRRAIAESDALLARRLAATNAMRTETPSLPTVDELAVRVLDLEGRIADDPTSAREALRQSLDNGTRHMEPLPDRA